MYILRMPKNKHAALDRSDILRLAAETGLDVRTVKRAADHGIGVLRVEVARDRLRAAANKLSLELPS